jgi:hypothetical protein
MKSKVLFSLSIFFLATLCLSAQVTSDAVVNFTAVVNPNPVSIVLSWENPVASNLLVLRRTKGQSGAQWVQLLSQNNSTLTGGADNNVLAGQVYEYVIQRTAGTQVSFGYIHVSVGASLPDAKGKVLILVDSVSAAGLTAELNQYKDNLRGDGYAPIQINVPLNATVASVKNIVVQQYNADPVNLRTLFLVGRIPIPYSGNTAWDAHTDHVGAWPADNYYADVDGIWTDATVNNVTASRAANRNIPGDGKFDQDIVPTAVELQVGRLDFRRLVAADFGSSELNLLKRYFVKNHRFRTKQYLPSNKALIDDNFGYFGGEAFASAGYRLGYALVGKPNVQTADFFNDTDANSFLYAYGCGGGTYLSANGVGSSLNFATDSINAVFTNLFGSYFGDWDFETNPFMPAALASKGSILTCGWAGRPTYFMHSMASGESIGYAMRETANASSNNGFYGTYGESGPHVTLLGDPTLRALVVPPPGNLTAVQNCNSVTLSWNKIVDPNVLGYYVFRATNIDGPYTRLTPTWLDAATFTDLAPPTGTVYYQVRTMRAEQTPGGGVYLNNSIGPIRTLNIATSTPPVVTATTTPINCINPSATLTAQSSQPVSTYTWTGPAGYTSSLSNPVVTQPGTYAVTVTSASGCTGTASVTVVADNTPPNLPTPSLSNNGVITCLVSTITASVNTNALCTWTGSNGSVTGTTVTISTPGTYTLLATGSNGCTATRTVVVTSNLTKPTVGVPQGLVLTCANTVTSIQATSSAPSSYLWSGPGVNTSAQTITISNPGTYLVTVTDNANGCSTTASTTVTQDITSPGITINGISTITCASPSVTLTGVSGSSNLTYSWSGPNGFTSTASSVVVSTAGTYTLQVTATNGCTSSTSQIVLADGTLPEVLVNVGGVLTCAVGAVQLTATTNTPGSTFIWTGPNNFTAAAPTTSVTNPGVYTVVIVAPNGCTASTVATVTQDVQLPVFNITTNPVVTCSNPCVQVISNNPTVIFSPSEVCDPGVYTIVATGSNGCTSVTSLTVVSAPDLSGNLPSVVLFCSQPTVVSANLSGGTPPYTYLWSNGATTPTTTLPNQPPFDLSLTVTDAAGCTLEIGDLIVVTPPAISVLPTVKNCTTFNSNDGSVTLNVTGGTGNFVYAWSNGQSGLMAINLAPGIYTCTITDATTGCTKTVSATITAPVATDEATYFGSLSINPNPADQMTTLECRETKKEVSFVRLTDSSGKIIWEQRVDSSRNFAIPIPTGSFVAGMYTMTIHGRDWVLSKKLVITHP